MFSAYRRLPVGVLVLSLCMGLGSSAATIVVSVSSLAGNEVAPDPKLATLPYGLQFIAMLSSAVPLTTLMGRIGRKPVTLMTTLFGGVGSGLVSASAMWLDSFVLLCLGHMLMGIFLGGLGFLRFEAIDRSPGDLRDQAISLAMFGGVLAGLIGPSLTRSAGIVFPFEGYTPAFLMFSAVTGTVVLMLLALPFPKDADTIRAAQAKRAEQAAARASGQSAKFEVLSNSKFWFAVLCGALAYGLMNLLMIATSLEMRNVGHSFEASTYVIQGHVLAMFGPSLISGLLIRWVRRDRFVALGMILMALAALTALLAPALWAFITALILVGLAWNFLFISSGSMVASLASPGEKLRAQGINDMLGSSFSAAGSLSAAVVLVIFGWSGLQIVALILLVPLIVFGVLVRFGGTGLSPQTGQTSP
ncbi:MAG: MFS transporter [Pseudomonadota bacterium]|nr:MFS transporter [Pseudomonadota bacterium]MEC8710674.1 MFS transporter [Pseudomonadota bacterium]